LQASITPKEVVMHKLFALLLLVAVASGGAFAAANAGGHGKGHQARTRATVLKLSASRTGALKFSKKTLSAKAGTVKLVMSNPSSSGLRHGIAVEGKGVDKDGPIVKPGKKSTLTVKLRKAGKYEFYCPFDSHKKLGMKGTLTIH
jgi:plastocyanin